VAIEDQPVTQLKGVGPGLSKKLERLGLFTLQDVLFHLPYRYQDRTRVTPLGGLRYGQEALVQGRIELCEIAYGRRRSLLCRISDGTGSLILRFFYFSSAQQKNLRRDRLVRCFGEARRGPASLEMVHPEYELFDVDGFDALPGISKSLTPVYSTTEGMHQLGVRKLVTQALERYLKHLPELLPPEVLNDFAFPALRDALSYVHAPPDDAPLEALRQGRHPAQQRLAFEELLAHHLSMRRLRDRHRSESARAMDVPGRLLKSLLAALPFVLTAAQQRVIDEILRDLREPLPMQRMVQGDVGSGKTIVAAAAALTAVEAGLQVAVMAPTEILAEQHYQNFRHWLEPLDVGIAWLSGKLKGRPRQEMLERIESGTAGIAVGTHALFQEAVTFNSLGLVIIDEQHRFGVHQRLALRNKADHDKCVPHQLIMTATPIPRTLAMTVYADLDLSVIDELPPGRRPVDTVVVPEDRREQVVVRVSRACQEGRQAYWVCAIIEESEVLQAQAAVATEAALKETFPDLRIGLVHGRLKPAEKAKVMSAFKAGELDLLVATTVIEVGVDVPNASLMVIENSERLGLSQLHQLRGRVGRGAAQSTCVLLYRPPLSENSRERLAAMRETNDGFEIARRDLELRGAGELLGTRQTGIQSLRIADIVRDRDLLPRVAQAGERLLGHDSEVVELIIRRWLGHAVQYGEV
jgi:ATP-dependent DNA helicase RecG